MKRYSSIARMLCASILVLALSGCGGAAERADLLRRSPPPEVQEPSEGGEAPAAEGGDLSFTVDVNTWADSAHAEDGTVLASCTFQVPELTARRDGGALLEAQTEEERAALASAQSFNDQFAAWTQGAELRELTELAQADWDWRAESGTQWLSEYYMELDCRPYQTDRMVSVAGECYSYTGGAHPNTVLMAWNFDLGSGAFFSPEQLAEDEGAFSQAVQSEIVRQIQATAAEAGVAAEDAFWSNYEEIAAEWSSYAVSFDEAGMTVAFSPYELACYAAGPQIFHLPYELLDPYLSDQGRALLGL